jgi:hypothetical protein
VLFDDHVIRELCKIETSDSGSLEKLRFKNPDDPINAPRPDLTFQPSVNKTDAMVSAILGTDSMHHLQKDAQAAFAEMDVQKELETLDASTDLDGLFTKAEIHGTSVADEIRKIRAVATRDQLATRLLRKRSIEPAPLPRASGVIPSARPKGSETTQRQQDLKEMLEENLGDLSAYDQQTIESLLSAMEAYVTLAIG